MIANLLTDPPGDMTDESFQEILSHPNLKIERPGTMAEEGILPIYIDGA